MHPLIVILLIFLRHILVALIIHAALVRESSLSDGNDLLVSNGVFRSALGVHLLFLLAHLLARLLKLRMTRKVLPKAEALSVLEIRLFLRRGDEFLILGAFSAESVEQIGWRGLLRRRKDNPFSD